MTAEQWRRVAELFDEVADLPLPERAAALDRACAGDAGLPPHRLEIGQRALLNLEGFVQPPDLHVQRQRDHRPARAIPRRWLW